MYSEHLCNLYSCQASRNEFWTLAVIVTVLKSAGVILRTPKAECRTPNAERRTPNAERRTPNAERRTPNAEAIFRLTRVLFRLTWVQGTLRLAWIALRLVFAFFGDFGSRSALGILRRRRSANYPCRIKMIKPNWLQGWYYGKREKFIGQYFNNM